MEYAAPISNSLIAGKQLVVIERYEGREVKLATEESEVDTE